MQRWRCSRSERFKQWLHECLQLGAKPAWSSTPPSHHPAASLLSPPFTPSTFSSFHLYCPSPSPRPTIYLSALAFSSFSTKTTLTHFLWNWFLKKESKKLLQPVSSFAWTANWQDFNATTKKKGPVKIVPVSLILVLYAKTTKQHRKQKVELSFSHAATLKRWFRRFREQRLLSVGLRVRLSRYD